MVSIDWNKIPTSPGVYIWKDENDRVLYIGKAKNLKSRMKQYFRDDLPPKNKLLMSKVTGFDYQVSASELDALLLEENLINKFEPKYNIKIKSAKRYPYIELKKDEGISLSISRTLRQKKGSKYFGPYPDGFSAAKLIKILSSALPVDECLSPKSGKACLNFEMGRCIGQCIGKVSEQQRDFVINQVEDFFKGNTDYIQTKIKARIDKNNELLNFEESKALFESLSLIEKLNEQKSLTFKDTRHRDIINYYIEDDNISISIMFVRFGSVSLTTNFISKLLNPDVNEYLESFVNRFYKQNMIPDEVVLPIETNIKLNDDCVISNPSSGTRKELLDLTKKHANEMYVTNVDSFLNRIKGYEETKEFIKSNIIDKDISTIEMVDISSTMGSEQVGAVVRFKDGEPTKSHYRKFNIKSIDKMDDYAATEEVVGRHFRNLIDNNEELPDLFIVDGKHQLNNAISILNELNINNVSVVGLIKDDKHTTNSLINSDGNVIDLDKKSKMYLFLSRLQEEVHRFVINFHRTKREKVIIESKLDDFQFLSEKDKQNLFKEFKSIRKILTANETELKKVLSDVKTKKFIEEMKNG